MIRSLINRTLRPFGLALHRIAPQKVTAVPKQAGMEDHLLARLHTDPLDHGAHLELARANAAKNNALTAYAEAKTAEFLGADPAVCRDLMAEIVKNRRSLEEMPYNIYYRFHSLAQAIKEIAGNERLSVLDVGGGNGGLASFIPELDYVLAEPRINGIAGEALPFAAKRFDLVVSCHVLEHIPRDQRDQFLDSLASNAKRSVVLLNPIHVPGVDENERLRLIIEITGAQWAQEHLDCILPRREEIEAYAQARGYSCTSVPNAMIPVTHGFVWVDHFAQKAGEHKAWRKINRYLNATMLDRVDSDVLPTALLSRIDLH